MTENTTIASRRERRARNTLASAVASNAGTAGRTAAVALAASGLVITSGVAANASAEGPSQEGREVTILQVNASELAVERTSNSAPVAVTASHEVDLAFDRPVVSTSPAPEPVQAQAPVATEAAVTPAAQQAPAQQSTQTYSQTAEQAPAQQSQQAPAQQSQQAPAQQSQSSGATAASSSEATSAPAEAPSGGNGSVARAAYAGIGTPYLWGGTSTAGFDCSGFINWAYARAGRGGLPRTTHGMMASLPRVSTPQPGDIVIANGQGHGGIYVGNGQVISATSSGGVRLHGAHEGWHQVTAYLRPGG
ncbi:C40 family peptidase [Nesterenkonia massiliensis]|uniref:C40 family peptidase n=1 Tax=Nesterenkonia massiliensis TaxID=1232429 RepID=UPI0003FF7C3D|nr:C40 family peptidase [Nesterenkonia massiliensis]